MKIPEELLPLVEWWERNSKEALTVIAVVLVAGLGYWAWETHRERARQADGEALLASLTSWSQCQIDPDGEEATRALETLRDAVATSGGKTAVLEKLLLANAYFRRGNPAEKDYENALALYEELQATFASNAALARDMGAYTDVPPLGRAHCLEALGRFDEALAAFEALASQESFGSVSAACGAARCLAQAGKKDEALARLEKLLAAPDVNATDAQALRFTSDLIKRWRPNRPAPEPEPVVETPVSEPVVETPAPAVETPAPIVEAQ